MSDRREAMSGEIIGIVGPTAAGKTELAIRVAEAVGAEIVSCDSMQIYRGFDIGTAKPTPAERERVPHHVIDVADAVDAFSAARYVELADRAIADIRARGRRVVVAGGTGLYLRALRYGLVDAPPRDEALRSRLLDEEQRRPGALHLRLLRVDPAAAARIAARDLVRVVRALEVYELTGQALSAHHAAHAPVERSPMRLAVLDPPPDVLAARIAVRVEIMLAGGLVDETRRLRARWGAASRPLGAVGYQEVGRFLDGELGFEALAPAIVAATRHYARRQRTWFKKEPGATAFGDPERLRAWLA
jgi:tRNA dimethylallyltransferase